MKYVYILQSLTYHEHFYTGITDDLKARLSMHNSGAVTHTASHRPWRIHPCPTCRRTRTVLFDHNTACVFQCSAALNHMGGVAPRGGIWLVIAQRVLTLFDERLVSLAGVVMLSVHHPYRF